MADKSAIEWTDATWNPIVGCSIVSPGCTNCYAMKMAARLDKMLPPERRGDCVLPHHYTALTKPSKGGPVWTGRVNIAPEHIITQPLRWKRGRRVFVNSMGDLFHESVPDEWIDRVFAVMGLCPQHTFQVLTKRADRMRQYLTGDWAHRAYSTAQRSPHFALGKISIIRNALPNVWFGVSAERQQEADERIPDLLATPAAVRFISAEPLLGPINLKRIRVARDHHTMIDALDGYAIADSIAGSGQERAMLDWVIVGGESGPNARPMHPDWARSLRDQCSAAGVPFFFKQWGEWSPSTPDASAGNPRSGWQTLKAHPHVARREELYPEAGAAFIARIGKKAAGRLLDGIEHNEFPTARAEAS